MGVDIYAAKLGELVVEEKDISPTSIEEVFRSDKYAVEIKSIDKYNDYNPQFPKGIYSVESINNNQFYMSYSSYYDFLMTFELMSRELEDTPHEFLCVQYQTIDGTYDYSIAQQMLEEFDKYHDQIIEFMTQWDDEYGEFMAVQFENYVDNLRYCVEVKGVMIHK